MEKSYLTLQPIWHTGEGREYGRGEIVDLSHLSERVQRNLALQGVVAEISSLLLINSIGPERARVFAVLGVCTLEALAEGTVEDLADKTGFTSKQIRAWQKEARLILEQPVEQAGQVEE